MSYKVNNYVLILSLSIICIFFFMAQGYFFKKGFLDASWSFLILLFYLLFVFIYSIAYYLQYKFERESFVFNPQASQLRISESEKLFKDLVKWRVMLNEALNDLNSCDQDIIKKPFSSEKGKTHDLENYSIVVTTVYAREASHHQFFLLNKKSGSSYYFNVNLMKRLNLKESFHFRVQCLDVLLDELEAKEASLIPDWQYFDFLYFSMITQTTIGYGDIVPHNKIAKVMVMMHSLTNLTLLVGIIQINVFK